MQVASNFTCIHLSATLDNDMTKTGGVSRALQKRYASFHVPYKEKKSEKSNQFYVPIKYPLNTKLGKKKNKKMWYRNSPKY